MIRVFRLWVYFLDYHIQKGKAMGALSEAITKQIIGETDGNAQLEKKAMDSWVQNKEQDLRDRFKDSVQDISAIRRKAVELKEDQDVIDVWTSMIAAYGRRVAQI